jgi:hypothetical protein
VTACEKDTVKVTVLPPSRGDSRAHSCKVTDLHMADSDIDHVIYYSTNVTSTQGMSRDYYHCGTEEVCIICGFSKRLLKENF